jgi:ubiquinone/menaquinone biosynthesis C-methylase UbiE
MTSHTLAGKSSSSLRLSAAGKDLVANRARLGPKQKLSILWSSLRENGFIWTSLLSIYGVSSGIAEASFDRLQRRKLEKKLPGLSSLRTNKEIWEHWNWESGGDEWTLCPEWKDSLIKNVLRRYIPPGGHVLEIGPGAGRWTGVLLEVADTFTAVDVAKSCIQVCQQKFGSQPRARFLVGSGKDLAGVAEASIDSIWSFDAFVHINIRETASYVNEFRRVMRSGAVGVIHHGKDGGLVGGWRSNLTCAVFRDLLQGAGFKVLHQFETWNDSGREYQVGLYHDEITVFSRP